ncbi:MAG: hypothetical protein JWN04_5078, partial [Myxococcaceae bacterium]|nr:hypothetical protein [Myxococcaceae bacterium]
REWRGKGPLYTAGIDPRHTSPDEKPAFIWHSDDWEDDDDQPSATTLRHRKMWV